MVGAMFPSNIKMEPKVPDVLISVIKSGTVVINSIPLNAVQAGPVMKHRSNALLPTQVTDSEVSQAAKNTAAHTMDHHNTDVILPATHAKNAKMVIKDAVQTEQLNVMNARIQIVQKCSNATKLIQTIQSVIHAQQEEIKLTAMQRKQNVKAATQKISCLHVMRRHSNANNLTIPVELSRQLVTLPALTIHHHNS